MADAEITIKTIDQTGAGFQSVSTRFEEFDQQVGNLEKNLRPLEEILKAPVCTHNPLNQNRTFHLFSQYKLVDLKNNVCLYKYFRDFLLSIHF